MKLKELEKTQKDIALLLEQLCKEKSFPNALLFTGENYSGRMFAAKALVNELEIPSENVLIVSDRNHNYRIRTALMLYKKNRNNSAKNFLKETIWTMLQSFHGALMDSQGPSGKKKFSDAAEVSDLLREIDTVDENNAEKYTEKLEKALSGLIDSTKTSSISVSQVRSIRDWCNTSSMDGVGKLVIIEGLENASDSATNALLKTLEEPPKDTYFIIIATNAGRIPATILSRTRKMRFKSLGDEEKKYILSSLFVNANQYNNLQEFFLQSSSIDDKFLSTCAKNLLLKQELDIPLLVKTLEATQSWDRFFEHVINEIRVSYLEGRLNQRRTEYLLEVVNEQIQKGNAFNQTKRLTFDFVLYRVQEINR